MLVDNKKLLNWKWKECSITQSSKNNQVTCCVDLLFAQLKIDTTQTPNNQITYEINYYSNNKQQSDNLQSKNSPHFQSDDVCIPEKWKSQLSKLMAGRMLLNLRSRARKNLHTLTTQQYRECQSQQQNIHFKSLTTTPAIGQSSLAV